MLFNESTHPYSGTIRLPSNGYCEVWDPWTMKMYRTGITSRKKPLVLQGYQTLIYVLSKNPPEDANTLPLYQVPAAPSASIPLNRHFTLELPYGKEVPVPSLTSWQNIPGLEDYSGTLTYRTTVHLVTVPARAVLSLGEVHEMA